MLDQFLVAVASASPAPMPKGVEDIKLLIETWDAHRSGARRVGRIFGFYFRVAVYAINTAVRWQSRHR